MLKVLYRSTLRSTNSRTLGLAMASRMSSGFSDMHITESLISHANASHFWLNEGWTVYMERVMQQEMYTPAERGFSYIIGRKLLDDALKDYMDRGLPKYTRLVIPFNEGENPDDAYSVIPYEKGSNFLFYLGE